MRRRLLEKGYTSAETCALPEPLLPLTKGDGHVAVSRRAHLCGRRLSDRYCGCINVVHTENIEVDLRMEWKKGRGWK